jgi:hypothetical protein
VMNLAATLVIAALAVGQAACRSEQRELDDAEKAIVSLRASASAIARAWLSGDVSGIYAQTALEATTLLIDKQRHALSASPKLLTNPKGVALSQQAERLSRAVATIWKAVGGRDVATARREVAAIDLSGPPAP